MAHDGASGSLQCFKLAASIAMRKLFLIFLPSLVFAGGPKYTYPTPRGLDDEMHNIYGTLAPKNTTPVIFIGPSAPTFAPNKAGDIFISTGTSKVYIATAAATSGSWAIVN